MSDNADAATFFGLGVGPGDPELITLKARNILRSVPVIAYPAPLCGSMARTIAAPHLPGGQTEIAIRTPIALGRFPDAAVYDRHAGKIAGHLDAGRDVAMLCAGDPFLYGSFLYVFTRLAQTYRVKVVPGVSSLGASAAVAGVPLAFRNQVLAVVPAPLATEALERYAREPHALAIMKVGRHLEKVRRVLSRVGREETALYVEHASMADERVLPLNRVDKGPAPYFSMILVPGADGAPR